MIKIKIQNPKFRMDYHLRCQRDFKSHVLKVVSLSKGLSPVVFLAVFVEETPELIETIDDTLKNIEKRKLNILWPAARCQRIFNDPMRFFFKMKLTVQNLSMNSIIIIHTIYCGNGVFTFMKEAEGEKYLALASSTRFSAACGLTISSP